MSSAAYRPLRAESGPLGNMMHETEFLQIDVNSRLAELSTEAMSVEATTPTCEIQEEFERRPDLPGAIIFDGDAMVGVISRETFFRRLSGPYCRDLFLHKPVRHLLDIWQASVMRLPADCTIHRATELVLARPAGETYEPIVVDFGEKGLRLLDAHTLLSAQSHLLSTSRALAQQRDAAEAANRSKTDFLAKVSHELRTPLHGILSYTRFGLNEVEDGDRGELRQFFENVQHNADTLLNLVNELLDYSKLEAGQMSLTVAKCSLGGLVETVVDEFRSMCAEKDVHIQYAAANEEIYVAADAERFRQVVRNLLSNAVKFSPAEGTVHIRIRGAEFGDCQRSRRRSRHHAQRSRTCLRQVLPIRPHVIDRGRHRTGAGNLPRDHERAQWPSVGRKQREFWQHLLL